MLSKPAFCIVAFAISGHASQFSLDMHDPLSFVDLAQTLALP